jgi:hypothetical protein
LDVVDEKVVSRAVRVVGGVVTGVDLSLVVYLPMVPEELCVFIATLDEDFWQDAEVRVVRLVGTQGLVTMIDIVDVGANVVGTLPCFSNCEEVIGACGGAVSMPSVGRGGFPFTSWPPAVEAG